MIRVLYNGVLNDYAIPKNGPSYEHYNLETGLKDFCITKQWEFQAFNPDLYIPEERFNKLKETIVDFQPDFLFSVNFNNDFDIPSETASLLHKQGGQLIEFHCDPVRRFEEFANRRHFVDWHITTEKRILEWYDKYKMKVIPSQYAVSSAYQQTYSGPRDIDVSFIGQDYGWRRKAVSILEHNGVNVQLYGKFWKNKHSDEDMIPFSKVLNILSRSKVSINFLGTFPGTTVADQIKGRTFEIPAMGACQVSTPAELLHEYFDNGKDIIYPDMDKHEGVKIMAEAIKNLLNDDNKCLAMAQAGYNRVWKEHTWVNRFEDIFTKIGAL